MLTILILTPLHSLSQTRGKNKTNKLTSITTTGETSYDIVFLVNIFRFLYDNLPQGFLRETDCEVARAKNIFLC